MRERCRSEHAVTEKAEGGWAPTRTDERAAQDHGAYPPDPATIRQKPLSSRGLRQLRCLIWSLSSATVSSTEIDCWHRGHFACGIRLPTKGATIEDTPPTSQ